MIKNQKLCDKIGLLCGKLCDFFRANLHCFTRFQTSEMSAIFVFTTKKTQPRPQVFLVNGALTSKKAAFLTSSVE